MEYGLIGKKLNYSFSKVIHDMIGLYDYRLHEVAPDDLDSFMKSREYRGFNVTIPYKKDVMPYLDVIDEPAASIGAVNTVYFRDGSLHGTNTDYTGFLWMADRAGIDFAGKKILIAGTGGAGIMAKKAVSDRGAANILIAGRKGPVLYEDIPSDIDIYVNATPVGTYPGNGDTNIDLSRFPNLCGVLDLIYNPAKTALLLAAEKRGIPFSNGLPMLVAQATAAGEFFTGRAFDRTEKPESANDSKDASRISDLNEKILSALVAQTRNITIVGMPGCGKSTIGKLLAEKLEMEFFDTDDLIREKYGKPAGTIIESEGEHSFRDKEAAVIAETTKEHGRIIATGGGSVLREKNRDAMRQNGPVIFLTRSITKLAKKGRPLSKNLESMYEKRLPLYKAACDFEVSNESRPEDTVSEIIYLI